MRKIKLTQGLYASVDAEDFDRLNQHRWYASKQGRGAKKIYAVRWSKKCDGSGYKKRFKIWMHRDVMGLPPRLLDDPRVVDHGEEGTLVNCKRNLEILTQTENMRRAKGWKQKIEEPFL